MPRDALSPVCDVTLGFTEEGTGVHRLSERRERRSGGYSSRSRTTHSQQRSPIDVPSYPFPVVSLTLHPHHRSD